MDRAEKARRSEPGQPQKKRRKIDKEGEASGRAEDNRREKREMPTATSPARRGGEVGMGKFSQQRGGGLLPQTSESIFPARDGGKRTYRARTRRMTSHRDKLKKA